MSSAAEKQRHVAPELGSTVDEVIDSFIRKADEWCGLAIVQAWLPVTNAGPARCYRVMPPRLNGCGKRIGVAVLDGLCVREATGAEEAELRECVALGMAQIERSSRIPSLNGVLHQSTGRVIGSKGVGQVVSVS